MTSKSKHEHSALLTWKEKVPTSCIFKEDFKACEKLNAEICFLSFFCFLFFFFFSLICLLFSPLPTVILNILQ